MTPCYPWFGGKAMVADLIWQALGNPAHYIEPCYGGGAVHLARPHAPTLETINDLDHYVVNFLRAVRTEWEAVAKWCEGPVAEADLHARHHWLVTQEAWHQRITTDPDYYDAQIAGWWVWGLCAWIGGGWCAPRQQHAQLPPLGGAGRGLHRKRPDLHCYGQGLLTQQGAAPMLAALAQRLSSPQLRICCGDWQRVCTPVVLNALGTLSLGIFLDPPYSKALRDDVYSTDTDPAAAMAAWARSIQARPNTRIVLCGYVGEHDMPGWTVYRWKTRGGMGNQGTGRGRANARKECLWFSPQCAIQQLGLFTEA